MKKAQALLLVACLTFGVFICGEKIHQANRLRSYAATLLQETSAIRSHDATEDVRQRWKQEFKDSYFENNQHSFGVHLNNAELSSWHLAKSAALTVDVYGGTGGITDVDLLYYSSNSKAPPAVALHQSSAGSDGPNRCTVRLQRTGTGNIWRAYVNFTFQSQIPFELSLGCLSSHKGCEDPQLLFPGLTSARSRCIEVQEAHVAGGPRFAIK